MTITYLGHSCFKLRTKRGSIVMDPYSAMVGWSLPRVSGTVVTLSHDHPDHNHAAGVSADSKREKPFVVAHPGEYEVNGISVFGLETFHDASGGSQRGTNTVFIVYADELRVCHLGDLGHELSAEDIEAIGSVDVLLCPVGGEFTIGPKEAVSVIHSLEPSIVIPMHFGTQKHDQSVFAGLKPLDQFLHAIGSDAAAQAELTVEKSSLPEETQVVVLQSKVVEE